jgi:hypothetical protein
MRLWHPARLCQCLLILQLWLVGSAPVHAQAGGLSIERGVKAAFLFKFLGYVESTPSLPQDGGAPLTVGVLGADDIAAELNRIAQGRNINGHPVLVRVLHEGDGPAGLQLLFVATEQTARAGPLLRAAQLAGVLGVTDASGGLQAGSVINFRLVDEHIRFEVSLDAAERGNIKLSSRLLSVAYAVLKSGS